MKKLATSLLAGTAALALGAAALPSASASPTSDSPRSGASSHRTDNRPGPLTRKQDRLRTKALSLLDNGSATMKRQPGGGATVAMPKGPSGSGASSYEFPVNRTDKIFTILAQFSDLPHNSIPQPDRSVDNSTYWEPDFNQTHYNEMFNGSTGGGGESFHDYYRQLSSGRYDVNVGVSDWVTVPGAGSSYGSNPHEDEGGSWDYISDAGNAWYADQVAQDKTPAQIRQELSQYDQWDRYDYDGDGNFNEPDGYIDHFQAIHSGEGEEAGGGSLGEDAIWSHRWYVNRGFGSTGPDDGGQFGGTEIGDSGIWIGDYTVEPENGGLGVFAHEFGHDLGLPDYYDTAGGENSTAFWTLMSSGSWLSHGEEAGDGIGTTPGLMGPEEKYELGWLDYSEVDPGESATVNLGPAQHTYDDPSTQANEADQAVKVNLPDKATTIDYVTPLASGHAWWSGRADNLQNTLTREVSTSGRTTVTAKAWYEIESGYDYLFGEYSTDGGKSWTTIDSVTGSSGGRWKRLRYSYKAHDPSLFRFRYATDGGVNLAGAFLDSIAVKTPSGTFTDGAENGANGWTADGWKISTGVETKTTKQYYLMENRQYVGYDDTLSTGPYQFCCAYTMPNWVEFFFFRPGMLVWYVDLAQADNNTSADPGRGAVLPVDSYPEPFNYPDGTMPSNRRQPFDATFGLGTNPRTCLHKEVLVGKGQKASVQTLEACAPERAQKATFLDSREDAYWSSANPWGSTKLPGSGVRATVTAESANHFLTVSVTNP